eukprot:CAMPEP_0203778398 /NCGR_PEP_ID=MMETSP0099_2-20121227/7974_1 /ASSEMBLY_ACC=CAM_ASM_000209 /TAXON_ID=96639 /ORGANISM=" , Strain NY0313808BC1" /LENGTH=98 /DNA_ID=CAMNT_0050677901 /DNA_START=100 /DNA_END=396 /DNA_ORIENTATION=+
MTPPVATAASRLDTNDDADDDTKNKDHSSKCPAKELELQPNLLLPTDKPVLAKSLMARKFKCHRFDSADWQMNKFKQQKELPTLKRAPSGLQHKTMLL